MAEEGVRRSSNGSIAIAWIIVIAPLTWGLTYTVKNALKLFTASPAPIAAPAAK